MSSFHLLMCLWRIESLVFSSFRIIGKPAKDKNLFQSKERYEIRTESRKGQDDFFGNDLGLVRMFNGLQGEVRWLSRRQFGVVFACYSTPTEDDMSLVFSRVKKIDQDHYEYFIVKYRDNFIYFVCFNNSEVCLAYPCDQSKNEHEEFALLLWELESIHKFSII